MRHNIDRFALIITIFLLLFFAISFFAPSIWQAVLFSLLGTLALSVLIQGISKRRNRDNMSYSTFLQTCIIRGNNYVFDIVAKALDIASPTIRDNTLIYRGKTAYANNSHHASAPPECGSDGITQGDILESSTTKGDNIMIVNALRFGNVSADEIIKYHNIAVERDIAELYIIARILDRRSMSIASSFADIKYIVIGARRLYHLAKKHSLAPKTATPHANKTNSFRQIAQIALSRNLAPRYLFTAVILGIMSVFTPLRIYYTVIASLALLLSLLCLSGISDAIAPTKLGVFGSNSHVKPPKQNKRNG